MTVDTLCIRDEVIVAALWLAADRYHPVVTGLAAIIDALLIERTTGKRRRGVAERAIQRGWNMVG